MELKPSRKLLADHLPFIHPSIVVRCCALQLVGSSLSLSLFSLPRRTREERGDGCSDFLASWTTGCNECNNTTVLCVLQGHGDAICEAYILQLWLLLVADEIARKFIHECVSEVFDALLSLCFFSFSTPCSLCFPCSLVPFFCCGVSCVGKDGRTYTHKGQKRGVQRWQIWWPFFTYEQPGMRFSSMHAFCAVTNLYRLRCLRFSSSVFFPYCSPSKLLLHNNTTVASSFSTGKYFALAHLPSFSLWIHSANCLLEQALSLELHEEALSSDLYEEAFSSTLYEEAKKHHHEVKNNSRKRRRSSSACIEAWWWGFMAIFGKLFFDVSSVSRQRNLWTWSPSFSV